MERRKIITIIGGSGGMGRVFAKFFRDMNYKVILNARDELKLNCVADELNVSYESDLRVSVKNADFIMVSVPIRTTTDIINEIAPFLKKDATLFDITSLKTEVFEELKKAAQNYPINCLSLHPMFGPGIRAFKNYVMIVLKIKGTKNYSSKVNELISLFEAVGLKINEIESPEEHDKIMALTLGVPHMFNILFLNLLKRSGKTLNDLTEFTGTTFLLQKVFAESIIQREMEMFGEIQIGNKQFHKLLNIFENLIREYRQTIKEESYPKFHEFFKSGLKYSQKDKHFKDSYKYFYKFMEILKKE
ncbi:MAG: putative Chorismate mutase [Promethearchaeota archaeon]|nr:MAG: putative Chorismate mutase [Candidatus Lokiarchaeota archaeon]